MKFWVRIDCGKCKGQFELGPKDFKPRDSCGCPNCGTLLPDDVYQHIKAGILEFSAVPEMFPESSNPFFGETFYVSIKECDLFGRHTD